MSTVYDIIKRPLRTEKTSAGEASGQYAFEVSLDATKGAIRDAVETLFGVDVTSVNTLRMAGKRKRFGRVFGKRSNWKKAYVTLKPGQEITFSSTAQAEDEEVDD